jgi:antitoxin YefM
LAQARAVLSEVIRRVHSQHVRVTVTVHGRPSAVILAVEDLEALEETIAVLADGDTLHQQAASDAELAR